MDLHVSSISLAEQCHSETASHLDWPDHSDLPLVAISAMVSTSDPTVTGAASVSPLPSRTAVLTRVHVGWEFVPCREVSRAALPGRVGSEEGMYELRFRTKSLAEDLCYVQD